MTGVMYFVARRTASTPIGKQSPAVRGAITASGESALRPSTAWNRSDCSVLVGMPVEGPARWQIGRASCRERVEMSGEVVSVVMKSYESDGGGDMGPIGTCDAVGI